MNPNRFDIESEIQRVNAAYLAVNNLNNEGDSMATYRITVTPSAGDTPRVRLVDSKTKAGAINHVAKDTIKAEVATTQDILGLGAAGVKLENANGAE